jgi:hypothetical protein
LVLEKPWVVDDGVIPFFWIFLFLFDSISVTTLSLLLNEGTREFIGKKTYCPCEYDCGLVRSEMTVSGLKINFEKSEVLMISTDSGKTIKYSDMYNCAVGQWPIKYLGVPVAGSRLRIKDWIKLVERVLKKLDGWQCS